MRVRRMYLPARKLSESSVDAACFCVYLFDRKEKKITKEKIEKDFGINVLNLGFNIFSHYAALFRIKFGMP